MRKLAYIEKIKSLKPIFGADKIECASVLGWELVVKKGEFKINDFCVFIEIDAIVPELPCFEFLRKYKFHVKTRKIKNQISQGLAIPIFILTEFDSGFDITLVNIGDDVTNILKITKFDSESNLDSEIEPIKRSWVSKKWSFLKWKIFGLKPQKRDDFPSYVPKTDEERVQKMGSALEKRQGELMYLTEKAEGTSATFVYRRSGNWFAKLLGKGYTFLVCSRNRIVYNSQKGGETNHHIYKVCLKYKIEEGLKKLNRNLAIQGENIGLKIQGDVYKLNDLDLKIFSVYDIDQKSYLSFHDMVCIINQLNLVMVPVLEINHELKNDVKYYVELSKGNSKINSEVKREGIVIRGMNSSFSFKSINPEYLLSQEL